MPTFLNSPLAWGALAFCVPLILHILNRSRFRQVEWGAMHLLESVVKVNHRRFRLEQLLLLLVRCLIPALLAFTLARPALTGGAAPSGSAPVSLVVLLDTSYSMEASSQGTSAFERAIASASRIIRTLPSGSEFSVIGTGGEPRPLFDSPIHDSEAIIRKLGTLQADFGASDTRRSIDEALATLADMHHVHRELLVISDFQSPDWNIDALAANVNSQVESLPIRPQLTLLTIPGTEESNVTVTSVTLPQRPFGVGQPMTIRANVRNYGSADVVAANVRLLVNGNEASRTKVDIAPNSTSQLAFLTEFAEPGSQVITVNVDYPDAIPGDNEYHASLRIWETLDVLLVDGDPSSAPLQSETGFLSIALTPFGFGRNQLVDLVRTRTVTHQADLKQEFSSQPQVVVLANVARLTDAQADQLQEYVSSGGALFIAPGNRIDASWYNQSMSGRNLLPAAFEHLNGSSDPEAQSMKVLARHFDHPALQYFNDRSHGDLSTISVRQWYGLHINEQTSQHETSRWKVAAADVSPSDNGPAINELRQPHIVARLENGDPFLVERPSGDGIVMQLATACDDDWSDLPIRPVFVPLMQQLIANLATRHHTPINLVAGEPAVAVFPVRNAEYDGKLPTLTLTKPNGKRVTIATTLSGNRLSARVDNTGLPGVYELLSPENSPVHFVAEAERGESQLSYLNETQLSDLAESIDAQLTPTADDWLKRDSFRRNGWEVWQYMLSGLLVFMFLELALQQRFSRVRS